MKSIYLSLLFVLIIVTACPLFAQEDVEDVDLKVIESYVVHCKDIAAMRQAQQQGVLIFEYKGRYFVNLGEKYEGVNTLEKAVWLRQQKGLPLPSEKQTQAEMESTGAFYNPQLMLFPFTDLSPQKEMLFTLPGSKQIPTSKIMIHPSPFVYNEVKFAPIDLSKSLQKLKAMGKNVPNSQNLPDDLQNQKQFAVTGKIAPQPSIQLDHNQLTYWVGASVIDGEGNTIWKSYGDVQADLGFKIIQLIPQTSQKPQFLLLFTLAKGTIQEMLRPKASLPEMDASGFEYHILNSIALEIGQDWFPPIDKATDEEYQKMMKEINKKPKLKQ